jgi:hypothetical protein
MRTERTEKAEKAERTRGRFGSAAEDVVTLSVAKGPKLRVFRM